MGSPYHVRNQRSRQRLADIVESLAPADFAVEAEGGWTVGALLAHVAFWDGFVASRWQNAHDNRRVSPLPLPDQIADLINGASIPIWRALPPAAVASLVHDRAEEVDEMIELLSEAAFQAISAEGRRGLVDRSIHRGEHVEAVERALARRPTAV
jgi:DinB superfamily